MARSTSPRYDDDHPGLPSRQISRVSRTAVVNVGRPPALILWTSTFLFLGFLAVLLVAIWIMKFDVGLTWASPNPQQRVQMFNYHPLFMTLGLLYLHGFANLIYRLFPTSNYLLVRLVHGLFQLTALVLVGMAIYAVYYFKTQSRGPISRHFRSTHSWLGLTVLGLIGLQFLCGFFGLLLPGFRGRWLENYRALHRFTGICIFLLACGTALAGIDQLERKSILLNSLAVVVVLYAINGIYILTKETYSRANPYDIVEATSQENIPILLASRDTHHTDLD